MGTFVEAEHPRGQAGNSGQFRDKERTAPGEDLTDSPAPVTFTGYDSVQEKVEAMRSELEGAVERLADDEEWKRHLDVMARFHQYSFGNQLLIAIQRPDATRLAGFKTWKAVGRSVRKGEKGISILAPRVVNAKDDNGQPKKDEDGRPVRTVVGFTSASIFDLSQTEGEDLPVIEQSLSETPPAGFQDDLETAITAEGFTVSYEQIPGSAQGFTDPKTKRVVIDQQLGEADRAVTLAHELGHIMCGHATEDGDEDGRTYTTSHGGKRGEMEVEAESFAYVLAKLNGMQTHQKAASTYVAGWQRHEPDAIRKVGERLSKAFKRTMTHPWRNVTGSPG